MPTAGYRLPLSKNLSPHKFFNFFDYLEHRDKTQRRYPAVSFMKPEDMDVLEGLLDKLTLAAILEMLERISHKKAENLRNNWQDEITAKLWEKAARQIEQINVDV